MYKPVAVLANDLCEQVLADETVLLKKAELLAKAPVIRDSIKFTVALSREVLAAINTALNLQFKGTVLPLQWIYGDTPIHRDHLINNADAAVDDGNTYIVYVSVPNKNALIIDQQILPLKGGDGYTFPQGRMHGAKNPFINMHNMDRQKEDCLKLVIGPMNNFGQRLGSNGAPAAKTRQPPFLPTKMNLQHLGRSLFSDNSMVYYQPHSLPGSNGNSGVKNSRAIKKRT